MSSAIIRRIAAVCFFLLCSSCQSNETTKSRVTVGLAPDADFPATIKIMVTNSSDRPVCIPEEEISNEYMNLIVSQGGRRVLSEGSVNHAGRIWKSINVVDPIYIVPRGKTVFYYDISQFPLNNGMVQIKADIKMVDCSDLFDSQVPSWFRVQGDMRYVKSTSIVK